MSTDDDKPGFFSRLRRAISTSVDEAIDSVSDPGQELSLLIDELGAEIKKAEKDLQQLVVDRKMLERKIADLETKEQGWVSRAEQALKLGDDKLARAALERKVELGQEKAALEQAVGEQARLIEDMREQIKQSKAKHQSLSMRRGTLMAQARAAKAGGASAASIGMGKASKIDEIEGKIAAIEALNEVHAETHVDQLEEARIDAELRKLDKGLELDAELAALKAKLGGQTSKALPRGKGE